MKWMHLSKEICIYGSINDREVVYILSYLRYANHSPPQILKWKRSRQLSDKHKEWDPYILRNKNQDNIPIAASPSNSLILISTDNVDGVLQKNGPVFPIALLPSTPAHPSDCQAWGLTQLPTAVLIQAACGTQRQEQSNLIQMLTSQLSETLSK